MSFLPAPLGGRPDAVLARTTGLTRLGAGGIWFLAAAVTIDPVAPAVICLAALVVLVRWSGLEPQVVARRMGPVFIAAIGLALVAALASPANREAGATVVLDLGPLHLTGPALAGALALGLRLIAIALTSVLVFGPGDVTAFADSLVQQARVPDRFAYGSVAALGLIPLLGADWNSTRAARRLRGLERRGPVGRAADVAGRLLVLLVAALRRAGRMALAMDARGFDSGIPRGRYRPVRTGRLDAIVLSGAAVVAALALLLARWL
ncbi:MAG: energy-coupling factor transporter transmembrane component T family protein [Candidatus Limnocylindrales bacterium]